MPNVQLFGARRVHEHGLSEVAACRTGARDGAFGGGRTRVDVDGDSVPNVHKRAGKKQFCGIAIRVTLDEDGGAVVWDDIACRASLAALQRKVVRHCAHCVG